MKSFFIKDILELDKVDRNNGNVAKEQKSHADTGRYLQLSIF